MTNQSVTEVHDRRQQRFRSHTGRGRSSQGRAMGSARRWPPGLPRRALASSYPHGAAINSRRSVVTPQRHTA